MNKRKFVSAYLPTLHAYTHKNHRQWYSQHQQVLSRDLFSTLHVNQAPQLSNSLISWPNNFHSYHQPEYGESTLLLPCKTKIG